MRKKVTKQDLRNAFDLVSQSEYKGVNGVYEVDSGNKGPVVGVTCVRTETNRVD